MDLGSLFSIIEYNFVLFSVDGSSEDEDWVEKVALKNSFFQRNLGCGHT